MLGLLLSKNCLFSDKPATFPDFSFRCISDNNAVRDDSLCFARNIRIILGALLCIFPLAAGADVCVYDMLQWVLMRFFCVYISVF